jgi:transcriptional regulator with XRE-family HTH domain
MKATKKVPRNWDPFPLQWLPRWVEWNEEHLKMKERLKDLIRPDGLPESARSLGKKLRLEREAQGLSVNQVSSGTFIKPRYIEAIERGDFEQLPGGLYTRRFVEHYAKYISLDLAVVRKALLPSTATTEIIKDSFIGAVKYKYGKPSAQSSTATKLPRLGEMLLYYFLSSDERDAFIGDLEEKYAVIESEFGTTSAEFFFYTEVLNSMSPLIVRFIIRLIIAFMDEMK